jgi:hypothetical protein
MVMSRDQNARRGYNIKNDNSFFERLEQFNYLGTTQMNQNSIQEENNALRECLLTSADYLALQFALQKHKY